jgi:hypothetical protein
VNGSRTFYILIYNGIEQIISSNNTILEFTFEPIDASISYKLEVYLNGAQNNIETSQQTQSTNIESSITETISGESNADSTSSVSSSYSTSNEESSSHEDTQQSQSQDDSKETYTTSSNESTQYSETHSNYTQYSQTQNSSTETLSSEPEESDGLDIQLTLIITNSIAQKFCLHGKDNLSWYLAISLSQ